MKNNFKDWLQRELNLRGWTYRDLEREAGVSKSSTGHIITGRRDITFDYCLKIAKAFDYSPVDVFLKAELISENDLDGYNKKYNCLQM